MADGWLDEALYPDWGQRFRVVRELARETTEFQEVVVFESASHGRVMVLDGVVQITERDEFAYQEMIAHVPLVAHGRARDVLLVGGGDGGVLRRVLQHRGVERVTMVEIDGAVVRLARQHLPSIGGGAWDDPRARVVVGDGVAHLRDAAPASVDVVVVDSTDPFGPGEALFGDAFYADVARVLRDDGVVVNQCGVPFMQPDELRDTSARRARHFDHVGAYVVAVPTYVGGLMALGYASKRAGLGGVEVGEVRARAKRSGILGSTRYWTPEVHVASFHLPPYVADALAG